MTFVLVFSPLFFFFLQMKSPEMQTTRSSRPTTPTTDPRGNSERGTGTRTKPSLELQVVLSSTSLPALLLRCDHRLLVHLLDQNLRFCSAPWLGLRQRMFSLTMSFRSEAADELKLCFFGWKEVPGLATSVLISSPCPFVDGSP